MHQSCMGPETSLSKMGRKVVLCLPSPTVTLEDNGEAMSTSGKQPHVLRQEARHVALLGLWESTKLK